MEGKEVSIDQSYRDANEKATEGGGLNTIRGKVAMDAPDRGMKGYAQGLVRKIIAALHHEEYKPEGETSTQDTSMPEDTPRT